MGRKNYGTRFDKLFGIYGGFSLTEPQKAVSVGMCGHSSRALNFEISSQR